MQRIWVQPDTLYRIIENFTALKDKFSCGIINGEVFGYLSWFPAVLWDALNLRTVVIELYQSGG